MFIVKYYLAGAIGLFLAAYFVQASYFALIFLWIAISLSLVCIAYLSDKPAIFRKRSDGSIPFYIKWMFFPFFLGAQAYNAWSRKNDSVPAIQKVGPHLYLACRLFPSDTDFLKDEGVHAILDATAEFDGLNWSAEDKNLDYLNVPILDHTSPHKDDLVHAVKWIANHIDNNKGVVVHCAMGRGRSVLIVAAYLLASKAFTDIDEALAHITDSRATARLNNLQYGKLKKMHEAGVLQKSRQALLIVNPVSGGGKWGENKAEVIQVLSQHYELSIEETTKERGAKEIALAHKEGAFDVIIAGGGDGTVNELADVYAGSQQCIGIIPLGTTNALSHVLFGNRSKIIPIERALEVITEGQPRFMDTAKCNGETMVLVTGLGFEQRMIKDADRDNKNESGEMAYINALGNAIKDNHSASYKIAINDGPQEEVSASSLVIANAAPFSSILAQGGEQPSPFDGLLDLTLLNTKDDRLIPLTALSIQSLTGLVFNDDSNNVVNGIEHKQVNKIVVENVSDDTLQYVVDGEVREDKKLSVEVQAGSLMMLCPKEY
ncbi:diacylglycerol kinase family protein [Glaciecola sp. 2405UD65-10]|uniref:diacylglycerol kinase family protein n=1 Tax=Glaciecola sp. 2405UD65-10 TaxID=3397244 RepID=UPI003B5AD8BF